MTRDISFARNAWEGSGLVYAYSYRFEETPVFLQREACIENRKNDSAVYGFDNISLLTEEKYGPETTVTACCAFEDLGAPLIVLADSMTRDPRGVCRYGDYLEVVLWKNGVNVWRMWMENGAVTWKQLLGVEFPVSEGEMHTLSVTAISIPWRSPLTAGSCGCMFRSCIRLSMWASMPARASIVFTVSKYPSLDHKIEVILWQEEQD